MYPTTGVNSNRLWGRAWLAYRGVFDEYWALADETIPQAKMALTNNPDPFTMHLKRKWN
jgi:hypothetical protein